MAGTKELRDGFLKAFGPWFLERMAGQHSFERLSRILERSKETVYDRVLHAADSPIHLEVSRHIIGIEGWGQRRLRVALGEPLRMGGHRAYRPSESLSCVDLALEFARTRMNTLGLIPLLEGAEYAHKIPHDGMGPLSVKAWLYYLHLHACIESFGLRRV